MERKNIVLCGRGSWLENAFFEIERYSLENDEKITIEYYISDEDMPYINLKRYTYETAPDIKSKYIVIACHDDEYIKIKKELIERHRIEFEDFSGYRFFGKKICVINANCYGFMIKQVLEQNSEFREKYGIYPVPAIHLNKEKEIDSNVLRHTDLYIHQDIRKNNAFSEKLSDEYILPLLTENCVSVCIPNFVGMLNSFYPNIYDKIYPNINNATMFFGDWLIEEAYSKCNQTENQQLDKVVDYILNYDFDENYIRTSFDKEVEKWKEREKNWDIKIVEYILDNYKEYPLFEDPNHPGEILLNEICRRLLQYINIQDVNYEKKYHSGCAMEIFVLPQVKEALGMTWKKEKVRLYTIDYCYHDRQPIDFRQFVQEYIWRVFGRVLL